MHASRPLREEAPDDRACLVKRGEVVAAKAALAVSEKQLQATRLQGCGASSRRDREARKLPDLKALGYPVLEREEVVVRSEVNDMSRGPEGAAQFQAPFAASPAAQAAGAALLARPMKDGDDVARRLAASIRGGGPTADLYGEAGPAAAVAPLLSSSPPSPFDRPNVVGRVVRRCRSELRALGYDVLHWDAISREDLEAEGCRDKLQYVLSRGGRGPFVLLAALLLAAAAVALYLLFFA